MVERNNNLWREKVFYSHPLILDHQSQCGPLDLVTFQLLHEETKKTRENDKGHFHSSFALTKRIGEEVDHHEKRRTSWREGEQACIPRLREERIHTTVKEERQHASQSWWHSYRGCCSSINCVHTVNKEGRPYCHLTGRFQQTCMNFEKEAGHDFQDI